MDGRNELQGRDAYLVRQCGCVVRSSRYYIVCAYIYPTTETAMYGVVARVVVVKASAAYA